MKLDEVISLLNGRSYSTGMDLKREVVLGCAGELMSDILGQPYHEDALLLTGLTHPQVIRAAGIGGAVAVVMVRGKTPPAEALDLATELGIPVIVTPFGMFKSCGLLYQAGLPALELA